MGNGGNVKPASRWYALAEFNFIKHLSNGLFFKHTFLTAVLLAASSLCGLLSAQNTLKGRVSDKKEIRYKTPRS